MRLLTHNLLACLKCNSYPLTIYADELSEIEVEFDAEFTRRILGRIHYEYLRDAFNKLRVEHHDIINTKCTEDLPVTLTRKRINKLDLQADDSNNDNSIKDNENDDDDEYNENNVIVDLSDNSSLLHNLHYALNVVAVRNGHLECSECKLCYPIKEFIPNFVLDEHK